MCKYEQYVLGFGPMDGGSCDEDSSAQTTSHHPDSCSVKPKAGCTTRP